MKLWYPVIAIMVTGMVVSSCSDSKTGEEKVFFDKSGMDTTVKPGDNFFEYANGNAVKKMTIPEDKRSWGNFELLAESNLNHLRTILEDAGKGDHPKGSMEQKLGDLYKSGMDTTAIDAKGAAPIEPVLARIDSVKDYQGLVTLIADLSAKGFQSLITYWVYPDAQNSSMNIFNVFQGGLSLPEKGYYIREDSATVQARKALVDYATKLFTLTGTNQEVAQKNAEALLALETQLAKFNRYPAELRDPPKNYHKLSIANLQKDEPNLNWPGLFTRLNLKVDSMNVGQPEYYQALNTLLATIPISDWKAKLKFDYISKNAEFLSKSFSDANFEFSKTFSGQQKDAVRWKKITKLIDKGVGELLGQLYVKNYFPPEAKARMDVLVNNLQKAFEIRINQLDWMSDSTKQKSLLKLHAFLKKIGYPDKWKNYDDVIIDKNDFFDNIVSIQTHLMKEMLDKYGKPVDRTEWMMTPPTVNAYYNPLGNEIVFPAGILQFPFFDPKADDAINYGGIGMVIGHEMTHGFDDQGSQYDDKGNMKNWWTVDDRKKFDAKTAVVQKQYDAYTVLDSLHVNGSLTLGENLADIGGLAIAYDAYKMTDEGKSDQKIDGLTGDQRFFLSYAQIWRSKTRPAYLQSSIKTNPHSPEIWRVNGAVFNFEPFYKAFNIQEGDKMYISPDQRANVW